MAKYLAAVRYGLMMTTENFQSDVEGLERGQLVLVRTRRGVDWGEIASNVTHVNREIKGLGEILRTASETDLGIIHHIRETKEPQEMRYCQDCIQERKLPMHLVGVEHLFSGEKVIFYFRAESRVDFRELVKDLARRYRTRIEMRQIGVRDESRLLADYGHCGRELCCRTFLRNMEPVTMRMAKTQKTTLDPSKISGHCGRLMCCLRFEDKVYEQLRKDLPNKGSWVVTPQMEGEVVDQNLLKEQVTIAIPGGDREVVHASEIVEVRRKSARGRWERGSDQADDKQKEKGGEPSAPPPAADRAEESKDERKGSA